MFHISIVIPLYNKSRYIETALNSILAQTYRYYEVTVVNDGSSDGSGVVVKTWLRKLDYPSKSKFRLIEQNNSGVSVARNVGISISVYQYVAFLDADDYWEANHLQNLIFLISSFGNDVDIFSSAVKQIANSQLVLPKLGKFQNFIGICDFFEVSLISNGFVHSSSVCVSKNAISEIGFPEGISNCEDIITWARLASKKGLAFHCERTSVNVIDNAEASLCANFDSYIYFGRMIKELDLPINNVYRYLFKYYLLHFMFARLSVNLSSFVKQWKSVVKYSGLASVCFALALLSPKPFIRLMRNIRKSQ